MRSLGVFEEVVNDVMILNDNVRRVGLMKFAKVSADDSAEICGHLDWSALGLKVLPDSLGNLKIAGDFVLHSNHLESLPVGIKTLQVAGNVYLFANPVAEDLAGRAMLPLHLSFLSIIFEEPHDFPTERYHVARPWKKPHGDV